MEGKQFELNFNNADEAPKDSSEENKSTFIEKNKDLIDDLYDKKGDAKRYL